jgi:molybdopterin converting factor small subunit
MSADETPRVDPAQLIERSRCALCPSDQICIWQCEHTRRMLKMLMGETLVKPSRAIKSTDEVAVVPPELLDLYN